MEPERADKRLRRAAAHAIDREAVTHAVFCGRGASATGFYAPASPWHMAGTAPAPGYDPDHARFLLRQARAVGTEVLLLALVSFPYLQHTAEVVQAMWSEVGFKVVIELCDERLLSKKRRDCAFHADATSCSYRWDPDGWFSRMLLSSAPSTRTSSGFKHAEVDTLIAAARRTADRQQRLELYTRIENIVNEELPLLYLHHITALQAGARHLKGYQPALSGLFSTRGGGVRTAWLS
jgi:peptide/nickel transport system substrate-binding protein